MTGCRFVNVVLRNGVNDNISNVIGPICSGYVPFHSVEILSEQLSSLFGLFEVACLTNLFREFEVAHYWKNMCKKILAYGWRGSDDSPK